MSGITPRPDPGWADGVQQAAWLCRKRDCDQVLSLVASGAVTVSDDMVRSLERARDEARAEASRLARRHAAVRARAF